MIYKNLKFPSYSNRPFFYTNFVQTVDGKVQVLKNSKGYWPIGSLADHKVLLELRAYADCLIHGKNLGLQFGEVTLKSLSDPSFKKSRKGLGKDPDLPYFIVTSKPPSLTHLLKAKTIKPTIVSSNLKSLVEQLKEAGYKHVLVEGGPHLLASFLKDDLLDEIFLTIAPKIFGNENQSTLTLVEGCLFPPAKVKKFKLISVKKVGDEVFLRYRVNS